MMLIWFRFMRVIYRCLSIVSFSFFRSNMYHEPTTNQTLPLSISLLILIFFSIKSRITGTSQRVTFAPSAAKYNPNNPTPDPISMIFFPFRSSYPYSFIQWSVFASTIAYHYHHKNYSCRCSTAITHQQITTFQNN